MDEKLYGGIPRQGKSYFFEKFEEEYCKMVKNSLDATVHIIDNYIDFWEDEMIQEFYYDVSPLTVLKELKKTIITGDYPIRMRDDLND